MDKIIYMDNAASTRLYDEAFAAMLPFLKDDHANPGGVYAYADSARKAVAQARWDLAATIGAHPGEIYFTAGGTESDNWVLKSMAAAARPGAERALYEMPGGGKPHIITSLFEHHAILNTCKYLERCGCRVSYVRPDPDGSVSPLDIERLICKDTVLISVMYVNNELGTIQQISRMGAMAHERGIPFHTDAVAAYGHIPINVKEMNIDFMSAGAHKFNGPKGAGFVYADERFRLSPFIHGGGQERGRRAGTENVAAIAGMAAAAVKHHKDMDASLARRRELDKYFVHKLEETGYCLCKRSGERKVRINGASEQGRLPGIFNLTIPGIEAEELIVRLGMEGICVSAGAACSSSSDESSHVLKAIGLDREGSNSTIRISMDEDNTEDEIDILFDRFSGLLG